MNALRLAFGSINQEWLSPWSKPVLQLVGIVTAGVLVLAAAAKAFGRGL